MFPNSVAHYKGRLFTERSGGPSPEAWAEAKRRQKWPIGVALVVTQGCGGTAPPLPPARGMVHIPKLGFQRIYYLVSRRTML
jgi:hypothetical protein